MLYARLKHIKVEWRRTLPVCFLALLLAGAFGSCRKKEKLGTADKLNPKGMPTMMTRNVATLISDSGVVQYKIVCPVWYVYEEIDTPCWRFPEGLYLRKYDRNFKVIASVAADSAKYFKDLKLWKLDGNVELTKAPNDLFLTQQLFWDERRGKLYSDSFIHIQTPTHTLEGYGFTSDDRLTEYSVHRPTGIFPAKMEEL